MRIIAKIEAWLWAAGEDWDAKAALEKNIIAMAGILVAILACMQLYFG